MATIKIYPRVDKPNKQGLVAVQLEAQSKGAKLRRMVKSVKIDPKNWDHATQRVNANQNNHQGINRLISQSYYELEKAVVDLEYSGQGFNRELIKSKVEGFNDSNVYNFWVRTMEIKGANLEPTTVKIYNTAFDRLKSFKPSLLFSEITLEFLESFENYLRVIHKNKDNTIHKVIKCLKAMVKRANATLNINNKAFDIYKMPYEDTHRDVIELKELDRLLKLLYDNTILHTFGPQAHKTLAMFCFQCMTGLRFSVTERFNVGEFVRGAIIRIGTDKTGREVYIPIHKRLLKLLDFVGYKFEDAPVNQSYNRFIKMIAAVAGININLTSHIAVHSFCVICLELGIPIEVISKLRGHASIKTTQIYTQVKNKLIDEQMAKWDQKA